MTLLTCAAVRRRLAAYYDRELPVAEQISVESHVKSCPPCTRELRALERVGDSLRLAAAPSPADDWAGLAPGVISRMCAENEESFRGRASRLLEDLHFVWIGLASTAASLLCAAIALGTVASAANERHDSLAAVFAVMAAPSGSDLNPARLDWRYRVPSVPQDSMVQQTLERSVLGDGRSDVDSMLALSAVVTRDGSVADLSVLRNSSGREQVTSLLSAISQARLQPAELEGAPIAVNLVWLVAQTTVRPIRGRS
jgi:Putative zinc-finger